MSIGVSDSVGIVDKPITGGKHTEKKRENVAKQSIKCVHLHSEGKLSGFD